VGSEQKPKNRLAGMVLVVLAAVAVAAFTQQAAAARIGALVASIWVSAMSVVLGIIAALFGAH